MVFSARLKFIISSLLFVYVIYLTTFKCPKLNENFLEHGAEKVLHPLSHHHNKACELINKGLTFVSPYAESAKGFIGSHVESHPKYQEYKIENKVTTIKTYYDLYVFPYVVKLFELIEIAEIYIYDQALKQYAALKALYKAQVKPVVG